MTFTTIDDVTGYLYGCDPGFDELDNEQMREIVRTHSAGTRYEDITEEQLDAMIHAAYVACGVEDPR